MKTCARCGLPLTPERIKYCSKRCQKTAYNLRREKTQQQRKLSYVTDIEIEEYFANTPEGYSVDHIIPLNHPDVCGLHVPCNFQYLTVEDNANKGNKFDGTYENEEWREVLIIQK